MVRKFVSSFIAVINIDYKNKYNNICIVLKLFLYTEREELKSLLYVYIFAGVFIVIINNDGNGILNKGRYN